MGLVMSLANPHRANNDVTRINVNKYLRGTNLGELLLLMLIGFKQIIMFPLLMVIQNDRCRVSRPFSTSEPKP